MLQFSHHLAKNLVWTFPVDTGLTGSIWTYRPVVYTYHVGMVFYFKSFSSTSETDGMQIESQDILSKDSLLNSIANFEFTCKMYSSISVCICGPNV